MRPHRLDALSLFAGLLFVALALVGLIDQLTLRVTDLQWLMPGALVGFGLILVLGTARNRGGSDERTPVAGPRSAPDAPAGSASAPTDARAASSATDPDNVEVDEHAGSGAGGDTLVLDEDEVSDGRRDDE